MRVLAALWTASWIASAALAQTTERTLQLQAQTPQDRGEIVTAVRTVSELRTVESKPDGSVRLAGPEEQVKLAEWVLKELDQSAPGSSPSAVYDYPDARGESKVQVFYAPFTETAPSFQELVTLIRTITDTRRVFQYNARRAMVMRGTQDQLSLTQSLWDEFARRASSPGGHSVSRDWTYAGPGGDPAVQVFHAGHTESVQDFQQLATLIRTVTDIRRVFTHNTLRTMAARGTPEQIDLARWLFDELDQPASGSRPAQERLAPGTQDVVRIIPAGSLTEQGARDIAARVQTDAAMKGLKLYGYKGALAARGTVLQVLELDRLSRN